MCLQCTGGCCGFPLALMCAVIKLSSQVSPLHYSFQYFICTKLDFKTRIENHLCSLDDEYRVAIFICELKKKQQGLPENRSSEMSENIKFWGKNKEKWSSSRPHDGLLCLYGTYYFDSLNKLQNLKLLRIKAQVATSKS